MRESAERHFALSMVGESGFSVRETLEGLLERTKRPEKKAEYEAELACPPIPPALNYLWKTFNRLRRRKGSNGFQASPIEWPDIDAFERKARFPLTQWEVEVIEDLDDLYLAELASNQKRNKTDKESGST